MRIDIEISLDGIPVQSVAERGQFDRDIYRAIAGVLDTYAARNRPIDYEIVVNQVD